MRNLTFVTIVIFLLFSSAVSQAQDGKFTFTISKAANTSAGVFKDDSILVRTLWNNVHYNTGTFTSSWDGKDDYGVSIVSTAKNFQVKVLTSNVNYQWQGILGNTSKSQTGSGVHRGYYHCMRGLVFTNGYGYYCRGYAEGAPSIAKFAIADPQTKIDFANAPNPGDVNYVATDDINVYWGIFDAYANSNSFVVASRVSDDADVNFSSGKAYTITYGKTYSKVISMVNKTNSYITGLAVQKQGNYLFVARAGLNQLQVINKTTGALVRTLSFPSPKSICMDKTDKIWMVTDINKVSKYTVNADGTLSSPLLTLSGLYKPAAIQVSMDGATVSIADDSTSQQVKFYSNTTGAFSSALGTSGGYFVSPDVNNNKFYFNDLRSNKLTFIAYQPDGSFWVGDPGNSRAQHYNASKAFINTIQSLGATYQTGVDKNNITRIFSDEMEFSVDYSIQTLSGSAGWKLVKNWGANIPASPYAGHPKYQTTLSNGRTYGFIKNGFNWEVVELPANGPMRFTGTKLIELSKILCADGSLQDCTLSGSSWIVKRFELTGFDAQNNPKWNTVPEILASAPTSSTGNPGAFPLTEVLTSSNKVVFYNYKAVVNNAGPVYSTGYHLGVINRGGKNWVVQTEKSTHRNYAGDFPNSGYFDEGNQVNDFAGGNVNVLGRHIFTSYHGEFWKLRQTNKYNHYWDNGLAIGQFGVTRWETTGESAPMMAGNALTPMIVKDANGDYYLYHGDESDHAGIHRWKITGLNTVQEQTISLAAPTTFNGKVGYIDLMKGLPFNAVMPTNTAGWTRFPVSNSTKDPFADYWSAFTSRLKYDRQSSPDISMKFIKPTNETYYVSRDLGTNNVNNSWKITGEIGYPDSRDGNSISQYFEVLDSKGKVLTRFYPNVDALATPVVESIIFNNKVIASGSEAVIKKAMDLMLPFEIQIVNGQVSFTYGNYPPVITTIQDAKGDWKTPKTMRIVFNSASPKGFPVYASNIGLSDCKLFLDFIPPAGVNQAPVANAGNDKSIVVPVNTVTFNGTATDVDGSIASYSWTKILGPTGGVISSPTSANTNITSLNLGMYRYQLKATDNKGAVSIDTVQVTVGKFNQAPIVNAGADISIAFPTLFTTLSGNVSDADGKIVDHKWSKISGPLTSVIALPASISSALTGLIPGVYEYELAATDDSGAVVKDTVKVNVNLSLLNKPPVVSAGADKTMTLPYSGTSLTGSGSDPDGTVKSYTWSKLSGPAMGVIASPNSATTLIYNLGVGTYEFEFAVMDNSYNISKDVMKVTVYPGTVNYAPVVNAGPDKSVSMPWNNTVVVGAATDIDGTISSYLWSKLSGPTSYFIDAPDSPGTIINNLSIGTYKFEFKATDNKGVTTRDTILVKVYDPLIPTPPANNPPVVNAGIDATVSQTTATLDGVSIDVDGSIQSFSWSEISGPGAIINSPKSPTTNISNLVSGTYVFQLTATDDDGATASDNVQITVNATGTQTNQLPTAKAGPDITTTSLALTTTLNGSGSDPDGTISKYAWTKISGPLTVGISSPNSASTIITSLLPGVYQFQLTVTDNKGAINTDIMEVTVNLLLSNKPPVANAGADNTINLPNTTATLTGNGSDSDGSISSYSWTTISSPGNAVITSPNSAVTSVKGLAQGVNKFQLKVTDNNGQVSVDEVQVTVNPASANKNPVANAGADKVISASSGSVALSGSGTDSDGNVVSYSWAGAVAPAAGFTIATSTQASTVVNNLVPGLYIFQLKIVDDKGAFGFDYVKITVQASASGRPSGANSSNTASSSSVVPVLTAPKFSNYKVNDLSVYPNPAANVTNLDITSIDPATTLSIKVLNTVGVAMIHKEIRSTQSKTLYKLDLSTLSTGAYFILVRFSDGTTIQKKIIKNG